MPFEEVNIIKILIADDENLVRLSIRSMIDEIDGEWVIAGEASNGAELVDQVKSYRPDVALVDIKMPKLNGLAAIRMVKELSLHTRFVILTGFGEFEYAQEALKLGVDDYLLKPVNPEELEHTLRKIEGEFIRQLHMANHQFEIELNSWLNYKTSPLDVFRPGLNWQGSIVFIDSSLDEATKAGFIKELRVLSRELIEKYRLADLFFAFTFLPCGEFAWVSAWNPQDNQIYKQFFKDVELRLEALRSSLISVTQYRSAECADPEMLFAQLDDLLRVNPLRAVIGVDKVWEPGSLAKYEKNSFAMHLGEAFLQLVQSFKDGAYLNHIKTIEQLALLFGTNGSSLASYASSIAAFIGSSLNCALKKDGSPDDWLKQLSEHGKKLLLAENYCVNNQKIDLVQQCITFMESSYASDISLAQVAGELNVTPNYLSTLFHKKTGCTFIRFLTKIRMLKAQELLANPTLQIQDVAEQVGYFSTRHFTKLFTDFTGCYPSEYRKKMEEEHRA